MSLLWTTAKELDMLTLIKLLLLDPNIFLISILTVIAVSLFFLLVFGIAEEIKNYKKINKKGEK